MRERVLGLSENVSMYFCISPQMYQLREISVSEISLLQHASKSNSRKSLNEDIIYFHTRCFDDSTADFVC